MHNVPANRIRVHSASWLLLPVAAVSTLTSRWRLVAFTLAFQMEFFKGGVFMCIPDNLIVDVKEYTYKVTRGGEVDDGTFEIL